MPLEKMSSNERLAAGSLAAIMCLRLVGLFMILPIFTLYAHGLTSATPLLIGIAMGIYGLTQALFQIPFGMLSDHLGRKPVITAGLALFILGSLIAACSHTIYSMVIGRALQGTGAIGSATIALLADLTRENQRTKAMAINGISIGASFGIAMIIGPVLANWIQVSGVFSLAACFGLGALVVLFTIVPTPPAATRHPDAEIEPTQFISLLKKPALIRLNLGIFLLHAIFTASFVALPMSLEKLAGLQSHQQWLLYVPTLSIAFLLSIAMITLAEKKQQLKQFFIAAILLLGLAEIGLNLWADNILMSALNVLLFFTAFSFLEACLPSWVSRIAPKTRKGTALGIYACAQFLGIFVGGAVAGWLYGVWGLKNVYLLCAGLTLIWLSLAIGMKAPQYSPSQGNA